MKVEEIIDRYKDQPEVRLALEIARSEETPRIFLKGLVGSSRAFVAVAMFRLIQRHHMIILPDKESAAYFYNDLEALFEETGQPYERKTVLFMPTTYKRHLEFDRIDRTNILTRTEVLNRLVASEKRTLIVTYAEAVSEKVARKRTLSKNTMKFKRGEKLSLDFVADLLAEHDFERVDFVYEPGQFSIRGGILDVFSFASENPFRVEFFGEEVESIRTFDPSTQLSVDRLDRITILPNLSSQMEMESRESFLSFMPGNPVVWIDDIVFTADMIRQQRKLVAQLPGQEEEEGEDQVVRLTPDHFITDRDFLEGILKYAVIEFGSKSFFSGAAEIVFDTQPQPSFNKNFELLTANLQVNTAGQVRNFILSDNPKQIERIYSIFDDIRQSTAGVEPFDFTTLNISLHEGFIDKKLKWAFYTDHQIFERYHKFHLKDSFASKEAITLRELYNLNPGDFVTHIDHGIGRFDGLEKIDINGRQQEAIRIIYQNNDLLYVSIHSLHRIAKYVGKDGAEPALSRLGSNAWNRLKNKAKTRVKDIAKELIKLYAERKSSQGFQFAPDTYLQTELEASFIYEDTPDQVKATGDVKTDMEKSWPMDRLICGDVGFGKTEVAIRAAFKSVADSKQVAVLVPTTILALQHFKTFRERLKDFPCSVDYINRFKSIKAQKETLKKLAEGKLDIIIGTHRLISSDVKFKDLGLMIIDEEQKFGVAAKEKLKRIRVNVDSLTLTATPIPRTLQFSLMGARDLSIINTAPPNRYPIQTEVRPFSGQIIRESILYEVSRGGQVFFVHNRVQNIHDVEKMILKFCPEVSVAVAHGQMDGSKLERVMLDFIEGQYDVLLATTIIESGLDIPNVNTIIINDAHHFGLSDLHQLRGRVGRSNKKAFCYLLSPAMSLLTQEARKRLKAIEEFSELGSGFNIAMRDLDIRGAGNILGAEQSGFISDIGFEMYHKILDEALNELKETEFRDLFGEEMKKDYVKDTQIETDLEILIPDWYITNITERLSLYKELDNIETDKYLERFRSRLTDRFGPIPPQTEELFDVIRLRGQAKKIGFEKLVLKNNRLIAYFISNQESFYYQSVTFSLVLDYIKDNPVKSRMKESNGKLSLTFLNISSVRDAIRVLAPIFDAVTAS